MGLPLSLLEMSVVCRFPQAAHAGVSIVINLDMLADPRQRHLRRQNRLTDHSTAKARMLPPLPFAGRCLCCS